MSNYAKKKHFSTNSLTYGRPYIRNGGRKVGSKSRDLTLVSMGPLFTGVRP